MKLPLSIFTIVFEGQPFVEGNIRESLRQADHVSVVEGATNREAPELGRGINITGHPDSKDGTVEILKRLQKQFPKLRVAYANGKYWPNKTQMVARALDGLPHGVLIQKDIDEYWFDSQIVTIRRLIEEGCYSDLEFQCRHFWASPNWHVALSSSGWAGGEPWRRAWLWYGEQPLSHEPPRFRRKWENVLDMEETRALGLVFFHGSYADYNNVLKKQKFYRLHDTQLVGPMMEWLKTAKTEGSCAGPMTHYKGPFPPDWPRFSPWPINHENNAKKPAPLVEAQSV